MPPDAIDAPITEHYDIEGVVGEGAYGVVHAARRLADGEAVVVKQIHIDSLSEHDQAAAIQEARMLSQFNHANIIRYHETRYQDGAQSLFNVCTLQRTYIYERGDNVIADCSSYACRRCWHAVRCMYAHGLSCA